MATGKTNASSGSNKGIELVTGMVSESMIVRDFYVTGVGENGLSTGNYFNGEQFHLQKNSIFIVEPGEALNPDMKPSVSGDVEEIKRDSGIAIYYVTGDFNIN